MSLILKKWPSYIVLFRHAVVTEDLNIALLRALLSYLYVAIILFNKISVMLFYLPV